MSTCVLETSFTRENVIQLSKDFNSFYKSHSVLDSIRLLLLRISNELNHVYITSNNIKVHQTKDYLKEFYEINVPQILNIKMKMSSHQPLTGWMPSLVNPSNFLHFNRLVAELKNKSYKKCTVDLIPLFREMIAIVGDSFQYEVEHEENYFNFTLVNTQSRHAIELELHLE